ncbi:MAG TPA: bifunctional [glutamine synthetase] adenylyltransferase/[glutamine synthetase]-adenylyl-L-tyrosine phosphorylase [Acidimicrobiia bacterium]|nr:bifunctional [glutamine synthetase] adenylyltransferase/[glutamine synthetase]-adenylyl-L-tyrosine phosphorylase [Acidimicrobiia bacterium]
MTDQRNATPAALAQERLRELVTDRTARDDLAERISSGPDPSGALDRLLPILAAAPDLARDADARRRVSAIAGSSRALSRSLARYPSLLIDGGLTSVTLQVHHALIAIAGDDLSGEIDLAEAIARYSDSMDRIVSNALAAARTATAEKHPIVEELPFSVIAMGKWGARELNYSSDIDFVLVHDNLDGADAESRSAALALAGRLLTILSTPTAEGEALEVDTDLRPEGSMGPLSRTLESYARYYEQWGAAWELQALLKARPAAGDEPLGARFIALTDSVIWERGLDVESLRSIRRIKEQVEQGASSTDIKRSRGGIRDIEFSIQLLQLVHGRLDVELRAPATLDALDALALHGFIGPEDHQGLTEAYRFLRNLEHRIQLWDLRQTHEVPAEPMARARIARSLGFENSPQQELEERLGQVQSVVRDVHERLYFRPILDALVGSPSARLGVEQAALRLEALGFANVEAAGKALEELTAGLSRRSRAMHQVLPLFLDWLSISPNPDLGLYQLRVLLANAPDHSALITMLENNPLAGERLCLLLGTSRLIGQLIDRIPEFVPRLADDALLGDIRPREAEIERLLGLLDSRPDQDAKVGTVRRFTRRRKLRIAARDILGEGSTPETLIALTNSADAAVTGALHIVTEGQADGFVVVAMGKWGGSELSYGSDLDVMYAFEPEGERERALRIATDLARVLTEPSRHGEAYALDAEIRPEGRRGPLARSLDSYRRYYQEWAQPWEILAMVRARPVAGDEKVAAAFRELIEPVVWHENVSESFLRSIRDIKARVENERIPPGEDPDYHLKLGKGSLSDIEFLTQLLQIQHGFDQPALRVPGTLDALAQLRNHDLLTRGEEETLRESYIFCTRVRLRLHLQAGRASDSLPTDPDELIRLASSLGYPRASELRDQYRRVTRRARTVFEKRFYE